MIFARKILGLTSVPIGDYLKNNAFFKALDGSRSIKACDIEAGGYPVMAPKLLPLEGNPFVQFSFSDVELQHNYPPGRLSASFELDSPNHPETWWPEVTAMMGDLAMQGVKTTGKYFKISMMLFVVRPGSSSKTHIHQDSGQELHAIRQLTSVHLNERLHIFDENKKPTRTVPYSTGHTVCFSDKTEFHQGESDINQTTQPYCRILLGLFECSP